MRQYRTMYDLSIEFGVHERTLAKIFKRVLTSLETTFKPELKWPTDEQFAQWKLASNKGTHMEHIVCYADGTIIQTARSVLKFARNEHDPVFCSHKHKHGINIVCVVNSDGKILWSTPWEQGSSNDQGISKRNKLRKDFIGKDYGIVADRGFTFNKSTHKKRVITAKSFAYEETLKDDASREDKRNYNKLLSSNRVIVENVFGRLKKWRIIGGFVRHLSHNTKKKDNFFDFDVLFEILCTFEQ